MLHYYFSKAATYFKPVADAQAAARRGKESVDALLTGLEIQLREKGYDFRALPAGKDGFAVADIHHPKRPNIGFLFHIEGDWNPTLENSGRRTAFIIHSAATAKSGIFYSGDPHHTDAVSTFMVREVTRYLNKAMDYAARIPE